ncbi:hypothetical protein F4779DRAFT_615305 [Xylariaceae sp. FL0662B]|nr:hypothetical protein F4779DRAFT_615305 [Xylariaceae sp. FL0662B]
MPQNVEQWDDGFESTEASVSEYGMQFSPSSTSSQYSGDGAWSAPYAPSYAPSDAGTCTTYSASTVSTFQGIHNQIPAAAAPVLPCEFAGLAPCEETYHPEEIELWIEHIITVHLQDKLPVKAICWFCDEWTFDSRSREVDDDRRLNFYNRMYHIREHIVGEGKTEHDIRPDFYMVEHLHRYQLISEKNYLRFKRWREKVPQTRHIRNPNFVPPERLQQQEREKRVIINHDSRERRRRRH